jgi:hypothetical protein
MRAKVTQEFKALRNPGDKKNSTFSPGEVLEGALAVSAVANGFARDIGEGKPAPKAEVKADKSDKKREGEGKPPPKGEGEA